MSVSSDEAVESENVRSVLKNNRDSVETTLNDSDEEFVETWFASRDM